MKRMYWRKSKTLAMLANKRQWEREFLPSQTPEVEIETGEPHFIALESSTPTNEIIIITE